MISFKSLVYSSLVAVFLLIVAYSPTAYAQGVDDFVVSSFSVEYDLSNMDPQGTLETIEKIELDFSGQNHGILRAIPQKNGKQDTNPRVNYVIRDGQPEPYITYEENDNLVVRIGDANVFVTGEHSYEISYTVENVITFYEDHDELYWDVNGDQWNQPFLEVDLTLRTTAELVDPRSKCFTGVFGAETSNCEIVDEANKFSIVTTKRLSPRETLTYVATFSKGYFTPLSWWQQNWKYIAGLALLAPQFLIVRRAYRKWYKYGKDYKSRGITVPYFGRPRKVSVMQAAYVANNKLSPKHVTASIIDLAIRGYIKIHESNDKKPKHELELVKVPDSGLTEDEKKLIKELFDKLEIGKRIKLEDKKQKMYEVVVDLRKLVDKKTKSKGYYEVSPISGGYMYAVEFLLGFLAVVIGYISSLFIGPVGVASGVLVLIAVIVFGILMTKRSKEGNMLKEHMEGLKLYLSIAEKDRLAAHDAVAAPLSARGTEPVRDVKFFEKLLPFAVVYGVEKTWSKAFADIYQEPPDWYGGSWSRFSTVAMMSSINSTATASSSAFSAPSGGGGSGSSGGFSGGGGGGGGGGGW